MNGEFLNLDYLKTFAGVVAVVTIIVEFLKLPIDRVWKIPTRFVVWGISLVVLFTATTLTGNLSFESAIFTVLNSIPVACASLGTYEISVKKIEDKFSRMFDFLKDDETP